MRFDNLVATLTSALSTPFPFGDVPSLVSYPNEQLTVPCTLQAFVSKYELNKRWLVFYASTLAAAYLYLRPFIRRKLGSAQRFGSLAPASRSWPSVFISDWTVAFSALSYQTSAAAGATSTCIRCTLRGWRLRSSSTCPAWSHSAWTCAPTSRRCS